ncbi:MAG TPA: metallophosphoesterase family protein [Chloroflexota bacterium]|nr:metallophosphoesterase family protein [Chloroflexota bacterium]
MTGGVALPRFNRTSQRVAILSDIHGNLAALQRVLDDLATQSTDRIVVAGDMVGFGPSSDAVVDLLIARGAEMIRGNHEQEYVAIYDTPAMPAEWKTRTRFGNGRWTMERLGTARRAFLVGLPDALDLDARTLVVHGSPRSARDAVLPTTSDADLEAMYTGSSARLVFMGHTHKPLIRDIPSRRLVNVGSVGLPFDGDPRASYAVVALPEDSEAAIPEVTLHRISYDLDAAVAAYGNGLAAADPYLAPILMLQVRTGGDYFANWLRYSGDVPDEELPAALQRFLASNKRQL